MRVRFFDHSLSIFVFGHPQRSTLCPYTTLFRSMVGNKAPMTLRPLPTCKEFLNYWRRGATRRRMFSMSPMETGRSEEHTSELQSPCNLVCRLLLEKKRDSLAPCIAGSCPQDW